MRWKIAPTLALALAACGGQRPLSAPAPADALDCAVREAEALGYRKLDGTERAGAVRLGRYVPPPPGQEGRGPLSPAGTTPDLGVAVLGGGDRGTLESQFRVWYDDGRLHVQAVSERAEATPETRVTGDASEDMELVFARCTGPATLTAPTGGAA